MRHGPTLQLRNRTALSAVPAAVRAFAMRRFVKVFGSRASLSVHAAMSPRQRCECVCVGAACVCHYVCVRMRAAPH